MRANAHLSIVLGLSVSLLLLSACAVATGVTVVKDTFFRDDAPLEQKSSVATDLMIQQSKDFLDHQVLFLTKPLVDKNDPTNISSEFGETVIAQVGERLRQLGYKMRTLQQDQAIPNARAIFQRTHGRQRPEILAHGTYNVQGDQIEIILFFNNNRDQQQYARFDFTVPRRREYARMIEPEIKAIKLDKNILF